MIHLITGVPGSGKSLRAMYYIKKFLEEGRPVFSNIDGCNCTAPFPEGGWVNTPDGSVCFIDEAQQLWPASRPGSIIPDDVKQMEIHRHTGHDLFIMTQHPALISHHIRRLVGRHEEIRRTGGLNTVAIISADRCLDLSDKHDKMNAEKTTWRYPKELFSMYKSATMHTVKRRLPQPIKIALVVLPVLFGLIGYMAYNSFLGRILFGRDAQASIQEKPQVKEEIKTKAIVPTPLFQPHLIQDDKEDIYISGCIADTRPDHLRCKCWDEDSIPLLLPIDDCLNIATSRLPAVFHVRSQPQAGPRPRGGSATDKTKT